MKSGDKVLTYLCSTMPRKNERTKERKNERKQESRVRKSESTLLTKNPLPKRRRSINSYPSSSIRKPGCDTDQPNDLPPEIQEV